jgi:sulfoxide reductase heme-binding subunit YedZ
MVSDGHLFWIASRAAGTVAMLLASCSVGLGLAMATRLGPFKTADLRTAHEALSLGTMAAIVIHAGSLLFDSYLSPSLADITIPFAGSYEPLWTSLGIVCGWSLLALGLSYYARARIGVARWRSLHRWTALVWLLALVHALGEGTDAGEAWFLASAAVVVLPALALLAVRLNPPKPKASAT